MSHNLPIGVFDSGVGGLTVLKTLEAQLPHESFVYLADTARLPYGDKTPQQIIAYFHEIAEWMKNHPIKMLMVACNTSSSLALPTLETLEDLPFPVIGTIQPTVSRVAFSHRCLGLIATQATVQSGAFEKNLKASNSNLSLHSIPCPKLVPLIESYNLNSEETRAIVYEYLSPLLQHPIEGLIYGCTHYPHLSPLIKNILPPQSAIINPADYMALEALSFLRTHNLLKTSGLAETTFYTTGCPQHFQSSLKIFYGKVTSVQKVNFL